MAHERGLRWILTPDLHRLIRFESSAITGSWLAGYMREAFRSDALNAQRELAWYAGDVLFVTTTTNDRRVLVPVAEALAGATDRPLEQPPVEASRTTPMLRWSMTARSAMRRFERLASEHSRGLDLYGLGRISADAIRARNLARRLVRWRRPSAIVIANPQAAVARSFLAEANTQRIPTCYIPHAPTATNALYRDIPTHYGGVQGQRDIEYYTTMGATSGLRVIGAPAVELPPAPPRSSDREIVVALSPFSPANVVAFVSTVVSACRGRQVTVCPHPSQTTGDFRAHVPAEWKIVEGQRTLDYVAERGGVLIQRTSGVGLEAMAAGVPIVEVELGEDSHTYLYLTDDRVRRVSTPHGLRTALDELSAGHRDAAMAAKAVAAEWLSTTGSEAADLGARLVSDAIGALPTQPVLDHWGNPSAVEELFIVDGGRG